MESNTDASEVQVDTNVDDAPESQHFSKRRSKVWIHFLSLNSTETKDGKERALCKYCKTSSFISNSSYGTSNMQKHLEKCKHYSAYKKSSGVDGEEVEDNVYDQKVYRELVATAIIKHGYAFSWVEHEGNRRIHAYLNNQVRTICRNTAKADCLKLHKSLKNKLKETLHNVSGRISLTCDMWTSCQTEGYLCLTAHYIDANWKLSSRVLNFCHIDSPHTGSTMYTVLLDLLQDWGIDYKIFSITLDNASSNDKMQDYLKDTFNARGALLCGGAYFHVRCAAHVLNLIVKDGLKVIEHIVVKIRDCVKYIKWLESRKNAFRQSVKLAKIQETKALWLDVPTRWNSTYMMLDRAILYREAFKQMAVVDSSFRHCPNTEEWEMLEKIRDILEPFYDITMMFSGSDYPTANLYFGNVWRILMLLRELTKSNEAVLKKAAIEMKKKFDKYWFNSSGEDDYSMLFAFAVILDPRYKLSFLKYCYESIFEDEIEATLKISDVRFKLGMLFKEYAPETRVPYETSLTSGSNSNTMSTSSSDHKRKFDIFADYDKREATSSCAKTQLDIYLDDPKMDRKVELDILNFWKENEHRYGELSRLARDILTVPLTTVASESTFSIGGRILNKWRSSYIPENVEALITTRSWLFGYESTEDEEFVGSFVDLNEKKSNR
ncbi:hypothetical protein GQ457_06G005140 [Hibiscus cannabinus]